MTTPGGSTASAASVEAAWDRVETWLAAHAPVTFAALAPPAEPAAIAATEEAIGLPFPEPLRSSLLRHDGTTEYRTLLPPFWRLLNVREIANSWRMRTDIHADVWPLGEDGDDDPDADHGPWWHRRWIPFAADDCGDYLVIDERATARRRGRIGNADHEDGCRFRQDAMWASLTALLAMTATALETGEQVGGCRPLVTSEGRLGWEIV